MTVNPIKTFQFGLMDISILIRLNQDKELVKISHMRVSVGSKKTSSFEFHGSSNSFK